MTKIVVDIARYQEGLSRLEQLPGVEVTVLEPPPGARLAPAARRFFLPWDAGREEAVAPGSAAPSRSSSASSPTMRTENAATSAAETEESNVTASATLPTGSFENRCASSTQVG